MKEEQPKKAVAEVEYWDNKGTYAKISADREIRTQEVLKTCKVVPVRPAQDPSRKLADRIATYHNLRKMRTDYKNYVKKYGQPEFSVPSEISGN